MSDKKLKIFIPKVLNEERRLLGFPSSEFFFVLIPGLVLANKSTLYGAIYFFFLYIIGKIRGKKPTDWFRYLPYLWLKISYPYLVPPGRKIYLP